MPRVRDAALMLLFCVRQSTMPTGKPVMAFWRSVPITLAAMLPAVLVPQPVPAQDRPSVEAAVVFVVDVSVSMDSQERRFVRSAHADALTSAPVVAAIANSTTGAIAAAYVEFDKGAHVAVPWRIIDGPSAAADFALGITEARCGTCFRPTGIGEGLAAAWHLFGALPADTPRLVVDLVGDGPQNTGVPIAPARAALLEKGATINALPLTDRPDLISSGELESLYREISGGPRSFAVPLTAIEQLPQILRQKILLELF
jgi:hypothetical protein